MVGTRGEGWEWMLGVEWGLGSDSQSGEGWDWKLVEGMASWLEEVLEKKWWVGD